MTSRPDTSAARSCWPPTEPTTPATAAQAIQPSNRRAAALPTTPQLHFYQGQLYRPEHRAAARRRAAGPGVHRQGVGQGPRAAPTRGAAALWCPRGQPRRTVDCAAHRHTGAPARGSASRLRKTTTTPPHAPADPYSPPVHRPPGEVFGFMKTFTTAHHRGRAGRPGCGRRRRSQHRPIRPSSYSRVAPTAVHRFLNPGLPARHHQRCGLVS